jgi:hypothetical protein
LTASNDTHTRASIQKGALLAGLLFLTVGVLGFVPGITRPYDQLTFATMSSRAELLGLFQVSILHNLVHLIFGVVGLVAARTPLRARNYLFVGGVIYLALFLFGLVARRSQANFIPVNSADNFLHLVFALGMIAASILLDRGPGWRDTLAHTDAQL